MPMCRIGQFTANIYNQLAFLEKAREDDLQTFSFQMRIDTKSINMCYRVVYQ